MLPEVAGCLELNQSPDGLLTQCKTSATIRRYWMDFGSIVGPVLDTLEPTKCVFFDVLLSNPVGALIPCESIDFVAGQGQRTHSSKIWVNKIPSGSHTILRWFCCSFSLFLGNVQQ